MALAWFKAILGHSGTASKTPDAATRRAARPKYRPTMDRLEDRVVPVTGVTNATATGLQALVNTLVGNNPSVSVTNIQYQGSTLQSGIFSGGAASVGIDTGVVLSTGVANTLVGPNNLAQSSQNFGGAGDPDLELISPVTFDANVLEFDFTATGNVLVFNFVFGSDEYPESVGSVPPVGIDSFGIFLNGQNVALVPGTGQPITINTVNINSNAQFFIDNQLGTRFTQMDGFTTVIPVILSVEPGVLNHIKFAIADQDDGDVNSWALIAGLGSNRVDVYRPLRYVYDATSDTYDGNVTVVNRTPVNLQGPTFVVFDDLPPGVTLDNPDGFTATGAPFKVVINNGGTLVSQQPARVFIKLRNPRAQYLGSFFQGFDIDVTTSIF